MIRKTIQYSKKIPEQALDGIPSSPGLAFGRAFIISPDNIIIPDEKIDESRIQEELNRFHGALHDLEAELNFILSRVSFESYNVQTIIQADLLIVKDDIFNNTVKNTILSGYSSESAIIKEFDKQKSFFNLTDDRTLRERAAEIDHIKERLLSFLRKRNIYYPVDEQSVVVAQSLTPADLVHFREAGIKGIITEVGGITSHASILARSFEIPAVIGVTNATEMIEHDSPLIIDGYYGKIFCNPKQKTIIEYQLRKSKEDLHRTELRDLVKLASKTIDGREIKLYANIDFMEDIETSIQVASEGIGLVRTENMIINLKHYPNEEEQYNWYCELADRIYPASVTIRVFDIGSDKYSEGILHHENNPALGLRGIRFLLSRPDIFETQIRAILRASRNKNIKMMIPMITHKSEADRAIQLIEKNKKELKAKHISFDEDISVGLMIETPAAALIADKLANIASFFSIGTNDLAQYTLAADRTNEMVSDIYNPLHPSVLQLIKLSVEAAQKYHLPVSICGELAGHAGATALLVGLGVDELSVSPSILLELKHRIRSINYKDSVRIAQAALQCTSYDEVRELLNIKN
ncbi:MAG: phosphoenolpyruvate--protein phosphotransferase [Candidatus Kapabacteria bacterium]|nr:phosphoenolpyruvate--protein phosphotransferase [Candidatus Kapabacteria bacterium]